MKRHPMVVVLSVLAVLTYTCSGCRGRVETASQVAPEEMVSEPMAAKEEAGVLPGPKPTVTVEVTQPEVSPETPTEQMPMPTDESTRDKEIQRALKNAGFYAGEIDGTVGPQTKAAIKDFQQAQGLEVDGKVGPKTWAELVKYLNP